jgi:hypothetical protein
MRTILSYFAAQTAFAGAIAVSAVAADYRLSDAPPQAAPLVLRQTPATGYVAIVTDGKISVFSREAAVHSLGKDLGHEDIAPLLEFLAVRPDPKDRNIAGLRYLKNEVMTALRNQNTAPTGFVKTLIAVYEDRLQDEVVRDYAVQHLGAAYEILQLSGEDRKSVREVLQEALRENDDTAGTALIALHLLSSGDSSFDSKFVNSNAVYLASATGIPNSVRVTAIQVCAERRLKDAIPAIERYAQSGPELLQVAAISALGELGGKKDIRLLSHNSAARANTVPVAIRKAIARIQSRLLNDEQF